LLVAGSLLLSGYSPTVALPSGDSQPVVTLTSRNAFGQVIRVVDPERNVHTFRHHPSNDPGGGGTPIPGNTDTSEGGYLAERVIDAASDPRRDSGRNPTPAALSQRFFYDPVGNLTRRVDGRGIEHRTAWNALGEVVRVIAAQETSQAYDVRDRGLEAVRYAAPGGPSDPRIFPRTSLTYSSGRTLSFGIDGLNRTQSIREGVLEIAGYEFVGGRPKLKAQGNGTREEIGYDGDRRLSQLAHLDAANGVIAGFAYDFDRANNRMFERSLHKVGQPADQYSYDSLSRVTGVSFSVPAAGGSPTRTTSYQFDGVHNFVRRVEDGVTTTFNAGSGGGTTVDVLNRYLRIDTVEPLGAFTTQAPVHDPAGARIREAARRLTFDAFERLIAVDRSFDGGGSWRRVGGYTYDAAGRRVTKDARAWLLRDDARLA